jgi:hypothetical protein
LYVSDDSGYQVGEGDLAFLAISFSEMIAMMNHDVPLGMNPQEYEQFQKTLLVAAERDGINDIDARLQGSAARFFSGAHKKMAYGRIEIVEDFERERDRLPEPLELQQIGELLNTVWPDPSERPLRRPFDAYYRLGFARDRSDYDVQISSDALAARARDKLAPLGLDDEYDIHHPNYRYIKKSLVYAVCPNLSAWAVLQSDVLRRTVTIAAFPGCGPEQHADERMSSHHRPDDWMITKGGESYA